MKRSRWRKVWFSSSMTLGCFFLFSGLGIGELDVKRLLKMEVLIRPEAKKVLKNKCNYSCIFIGFNGIII